MSALVRPVLVLLVVLAPHAALAHEVGGGGGFLTGFTHPLLGLDHVAAMVAVGLWGAFLGAPALWVLPVAFPLVMAAGGALALAGVTVPSIELGIALSGLVLGLMVAFAVRPALALAGLLVAAFAVFHGYAHGLEMPEAADPAAYALGFVLGTGLLHLAGIGLGALAGFPAGRLAVRAGGAAIAAMGVYFTVGVLQGA